MISRAILGTTSYGFRYLLRDERRAPPLAHLVGRVADLQLEAFQVCENARPLALPPGGWKDAVNAARDRRVELHVGCMTLDPATLARYMDLAAAMPNPLVRVVLEEEGQGAATHEAIERFLDKARPRVERAGMTLAIENHFHIPCRKLAELAFRLPPPSAGFCIDTANSLRNWESPAQVLALLGPRALEFHLKDFVVRGSNVGFSVGGSPLGEGDLDLAWCAERILKHNPAPRVFLENWVPETGDWRADVAADAEWLRRSAEGAREVLVNAPSSERESF